MKTIYTVTWEIDLEASSPRKAAETALAWLREDGAECVIFGVKEHGSSETEELIDLMEDDDD